MADMYSGSLSQFKVRNGDDAQQADKPTISDLTFALMYMNENENSASELELRGLESLVIATVEEDDDEGAMNSGRAVPNKAGEDGGSNVTGGSKADAQSLRATSDYYHQSCNSSETNSNPTNHYFATTSSLFGDSKSANNSNMNAAHPGIFMSANNSSSNVNVNVMAVPHSGNVLPANALKSTAMPYVFPTGVPLATVASMNGQQPMVSPDYCGSRSTAFTDGSSTHTLSFAASPLPSQSSMVAGSMYSLVGQASPISSPSGSMSPSPASVPMNDDEVRSNLFICGLSPDVGDNELHSLFGNYGEIESAKVMLDIHSGLSRCIAFVKFVDAKCAERALEELNGTMHFNHQVTVRVANSRAAYLPGSPTNKTFVRNVPLTVTKTELLKYFSTFGEVTDVSVHADTAQGRSGSSAANGNNSNGGNSKLNIVFVTFATKEAAAKAAEETHTKAPFPQCNGVPLLAKVAEDSMRRVERLARRFRPNSGNGSNRSNSTTAATQPGAANSGRNNGSNGGRRNNNNSTNNNNNNAARAGNSRGSNSDSYQQSGLVATLESQQSPFLVAVPQGSHPAYMAPTAAPFMVMAPPAGIPFMYAPMGAPMQASFNAISTAPGAGAGQYFLVMNNQQQPHRG